MNNDVRYKVIPEIEGEKMKFFFESTGSSSVVKAIEYSPITILDGKPVYNLGFGDYNIETKKVSDTSISNNGDVYKVFNTVLSTVPPFFEKNPSGIIFVQGSDSDPDYFNHCKISCKKRCTDKCKNEGRRIMLYRNFVNKYYSSLSNDYIFKGGIKYEESKRTVIEDYVVGKHYEAILVSKRK